MDVVIDISLSPRASGSHFRRRSIGEQSLEQLALSLEEAAFRLLEHENHAYMAGEFDEVAKFAKWRSEIRLAADALLRAADLWQWNAGPGNDEQVGRGPFLWRRPNGQLRPTTAASREMTKWRNERHRATDSLRKDRNDD